MKHYFIPCGACLFGIFTVWSFFVWRFYVFLVNLFKFILVDAPFLLRNFIFQLTLWFLMTELSTCPTPDYILLSKAQFVDIDVLFGFFVFFLSILVWQLFHASDSYDYLMHRILSWSSVEINHFPEFSGLLALSKRFKTYFGMCFLNKHMCLVSHRPLLLDQLQKHV